MESKKVLILYYSRKGTVKNIAEKISIKLGCDIEEIFDNKSRKGIIGFISAGKDAAKDKLTEIKPINSDLTQYDLIIVCTPVWASKISTPIRTVLVQKADKIKDIAVFASSGGPGDNKVVSNVEAITGKKVTAELMLSNKDYKSDTADAKIDEFIKKL